MELLERVLEVVFDNEGVAKSERILMRKEIVLLIKEIIETSKISVD